MALTTPFAQNGDKKEIPQTTSDGSLSFDRGFGSLYALPPEEGGLFIDREQFNQLVYQITEAILANQQSLSSLSGNVYNKGEVDNLVNAKANQSTTYTKDEVNNLVNPKANANAVYTKTEVNNLVNAKANANATVNLTGNQTIAGVKTFSSPVVVPNATANTHAVNLAQLNTKANQATTYTKTEVNNLVNAKANANAVVNLSGNQTIAGTKTWSSPLVIPNGTANNHAVNLGQLNAKANDNAVVKLSGNQTIGGNKKFSAVPTCDISPTANNHLANKAYIDSINQVPDYSSGVSIPANKAFTAQFNGVAEIYCRAGSGYHWAFCLGNTNYNNKTIMSGTTSGSGEVWDAGQAIIIKGETYYFYANAYIYKAMMYPFKSQTQSASNARFRRI